MHGDQATNAKHEVVAPEAPATGDEFNFVWRGFPVVRFSHRLVSFSSENQLTVNA
jgi:low affinity Fe/Cu permease